MPPERKRNHELQQLRRNTDLFSITLTRDGFWIKVNEQRVTSRYPDMSHWFLLGISRYGVILKIANRNLIDWMPDK